MKADIVARKMFLMMLKHDCVETILKLDTLSIIKSEHYRQKNQQLCVSVCDVMTCYGCSAS